MLTLVVVGAGWVYGLGSRCISLSCLAHRGAWWANSIRTARLVPQRTVVLNACCMNQRGSLGVRNLPEEVQRTEAMVVGMNADIGYYLEVRISALCAVSVERPSVLGGVFLCL